MFREDLSAATSTTVRPDARNSNQFDSSAFAPTRCEWTDRAIRRLTELCHLPVGWDGHHGLPTNRDTAYFAATIVALMMNPRIPMPSILPLSNGGLQIEWHRNQWDVEIEVAGPYHIAVYTNDLTSGVDHEFALKSIDVGSLSPVLAKIAFV